jgi:hypothetical protein
MGQNRDAERPCWQGTPAPAGSGTWRRYGADAAPSTVFEVHPELKARSA